MEEGSNPTAQGTSAEGTSASQQEMQQQESAVPDGVQRRIDELTAQFRESERRGQQMLQSLAEAQLQNTKLQQLLMQQGQQQGQQEELDPSNPVHLQKLLERAAEKATAPLLQRMEQLTTQVHETRLNPEMHQVQTQLAKLNNPLVAARVDALLGQWRSTGALQSGVATPLDALKIAMGESAMGQLGVANQSRDERGRFNRTDTTPVLTGQAGGRRAPVNQVAPLEMQLQQANLNDMSEAQLSKLIADIEAKNPDGVDLS